MATFAEGDLHVVHAAATSSDLELVLCISDLKVFTSPATAEAMAYDGVKRETVEMFVLDKEVKA